MMALVFFKIAALAMLVFLLMLLIDGFCNHKNKAKGIYKSKVPVFVPIIGGIAGSTMVISVMAAILTAIWS